MVGSEGNGQNPRALRIEEKSLLIRSCEILAQMRDVVKERDYESGFELLEMFISPIKQTTATSTSDSADTTTTGGGSN